MDEHKPRMPVKATFLMPAHSGEPIYIEMPRQALRMAVVNRHSLAALGAEWEAVGVYVLLGNAPDDLEEGYYAYAGKATTGGLRTRIKQHLADRDKNWFDRVLLVADASSHGFSSAEAGWLEGQLYDVLKNAPTAAVRNGNRPQDESLPPYDKEELRRTIKTITSVMRTIGASPDTRDQTVVVVKRKPKRIDVGIPDLLSAGLLVPGTVLYCTWLNRSDLEETATLLADGRLVVEGQEYDSPSAAAAAARGGTANGWTFWGVKSSDGSIVSLSKLRAPLEEERDEEPA